MPLMSYIYRVAMIINQSYELVAINKLKSHPRNPRKGNVPIIQESIDSNGFFGALVVQKSTGYILAGNHRYLAAKGKEKELPVTWVDVDDQTALRILLADNRTSDLGIYDNTALAELLQQIDNEIGSLVGTGYSNEDLDELLQSIGNAVLIAEGNGGDDFDTNPPTVATRCKLGDLWQLGEHRLLVGDCKSEINLKNLIENNKPDIILTDPPYGMRLEADFSDMKSSLQMLDGKNIKGGKKYDNVIGDNEDFDAGFFTKRFDHVKEQFWFGADYYSKTLGDTMHTGAWIVWDKRLDESADRMYGSCFELIWSRQKHKRDILRHKWAGVFGIEKEPLKRRDHPNQKPLVLIEDILNRYSEKNYLILDFYLGSGTTLIAAQRTGRKCYGMEISPEYGDVILKRFEAETGIEPKLIKNIYANEN